MKINSFLVCLLLLPTTLFALSGRANVVGIDDDQEVKNELLNVEDIPKIKITIEGTSTSCELDKSSKIYICPNAGKPILVKYSTFGFSALTKDDKNTIKAPYIGHVETDDTVLFEAPKIEAGNQFGGEYKFKPDETNDLRKEFSNTIMAIDSFFENYSLRPIKGSDKYEKLAKTFLDEKKKLQKIIEITSKEQNYSIELEDGQKVECERGKTRALSKEQKEQEDYLKQFGMNVLCGSFKCSPVVVDGKKYETTMLYESSPGSLAQPSLHLSNQGESGPDKIIKKITAKSSSIPVIDNSYYLENRDNSEDRFDISYMLPASLKQDSNKILMFKDQGFGQLLEYQKNICSDIKPLNNIVEAKKKLLIKLANADLVEFIKVLENGALLGEFIDPALGPKMGCFYQGAYLNEAAAKNLDIIKKNLHPDKHVDQTITLDRATELFNSAAEMKDIAWNYKPDGCYARAHLMARRFEAQGVRVDKVWIKGNLYVPGTNPLIRWNFHVAPIVYVDDGKGNVQKMVIDPSLFTKPVTVEEWDKKMSKETVKGSVVTAFPFPQNSALMERSTLSFSSSDPYLPGDNIQLSEEKKMELANKTMKEYKPLETR